MDVYSFIARGMLSNAALDRAGRRRRASIGLEDVDQLRRSLSYDTLDPEHLVVAQRMANVYAALHCFENTVRHFVQQGMADSFDEEWWNKVPERIRKRVQTRMEDDAKFRFHGVRGGEQMAYCDFGDLSSIITVNWTAFEPVVVDLEWCKSLLGAMERSRNIVMHGGELGRVDIDRIGMHIRDWMNQVG